MGSIFPPVALGGVFSCESSKAQKRELEKADKDWRAVTLAVGRSPKRDQTLTWVSNWKLG